MGELIKRLISHELSKWIFLIVLGVIGAGVSLIVKLVMHVVGCSPATIQVVAEKVGVGVAGGLFVLLMIFGLIMKLGEVLGGPPPLPKGAPNQPPPLPNQGRVQPPPLPVARTDGQEAKTSSGYRRDEGRGHYLK